VAFRLFLAKGGPNEVARQQNLLYRAQYGPSPFRDGTVPRGQWSEQV